MFVLPGPLQSIGASAQVPPARAQLVAQVARPMIMPHIRMRLFRLALCLVTIAVIGAVDDPVMVVRARLGELAKTEDGGSDQIAAWIAGLADDGRWPDIDYRSKRLASWPTAEHWRRLRALAVAATTTGEAGKPALLAAIGRGIDGWMRDRPVSPNWFSNEIGVPQSAAQVQLLVGAQLDPARIAALRQFIGKPLDEGRKSTFTGQNLFWRAGIVLNAAAADGDRAGIARAAERSRSVLVVSTGEGIQPDASYHQHGPQLYSLGYGSALTSDAAKLIQVLAGTPWAVPPDESAAVTGLLLDGQRWLLRGGRWDPSAGSRSISRAPGSAAPFITPVRQLVEAGIARSDELAVFGRWLAKPVGAPVEGVRCFWRSDLSIGQFPHWSVSIKTSSRRTRRSETINEENLRGRFLCDGVTWLRPLGDEYAGIIPLLDWQGLPGLTAAQAAKQPGGAAYGLSGTAIWAGGASDGHRGVHAFEQRQDGLSATRCWFILPDGLVALGHGIGHPELPVRTTIDQCLRRGEVIIASGGGAAKPASDGKTAITGPAEVRHAGLTYRIPAGAAATLSLATRTGAWRDINVAQSDQPVTAPMLQLAIDHGRCTAAELAYEVAATGDGNPLATVLANGGGVQAVRIADGTMLAAFREAGRLAVGGDELAVDRAAVLILDPTGGTLHLADPLWHTVKDPPATITVTWRGRTLAVKLPDGPLTGSTVRAKLP